MTTDRDTDIDGLAGEFVLGTLSADERRAVEARLRAEPQLARAIAAWERRLDPLAAAVPAVAPPRDLFAKIETRIEALGAQQAQTSAEIVDLTRRLNVWRRVAAITTAVAAALVAVLALNVEKLRAPSGNLVAVLQKDAQSPAFLVTVNTASRIMTVQTVSATAKPGKSYELWLVHETLSAPKSLGVIAAAPLVEKAALKGYDATMLAGATFAVSLEPEGGSPNGKPTEVVFAGKVIASAEPAP